MIYTSKDYKHVSAYNPDRGIKPMAEDKKYP